MVTKYKVLILFVFLILTMPRVNTQFYYSETVTAVDMVFTETTRQKVFLLGAGFFTTNAADPKLLIIKQGITLVPTVTVTLFLLII